MKFALTGEKLIHLILVLVVFGESELLVDFFVFRKGINNVLYTFLHNFLHRLLIIQLRFLGKVTHRVTGREDYLTLIIIIQPSNNLHQCRFTSTVQTNDTNLSAVEETEINVLKNRLVRLLDGLCQAHHRENNFLIVNCCHKYSMFLLFQNVATEKLIFLLRALTFGKFTK